jgi:hypothetical protein
MSEPKVYEQRTPSPFEKEYILANDGVFYSREIITTPITNQRNLVERCQFAETLNLNQCVNRLEINDPSSDRSSVPYSSCYYEGYYDSDYSRKHIYVPIYAFPFPKADLTKININFEETVNNNGDPSYEYQLTPNQYSRDFVNRVIPKYTPRFYSEAHQLYVHFIIADSNYQNGLIGTRTVGYPTLFGVNRTTKEPVAIDLPNVYDTGKICTGDSYGQIDDRSELSTHDIVRHTMKELFSSPANTDLYPNDAFVKAYLMFNSEGEALLPPTRTSSGISNPYATKERGFFFPITKSSVLDFTSILWK